MKKKILIIDDEPMMIRLACKFLSAEYDVVTAGSGKEGISLYESEKPDLILSDLLMPEMSGFEMHMILQEKYGCKIPIMFMTADESEDVEGTGFDLGAADFIRKPFSPPVLLKRVENILKNVDMINDLREEATIDRMTGFLNKAGVSERLTTVCAVESGVLMIIDLDSFKLVNDLYGHETGDKVLKAFSDITRGCVRSDDIVGRIGGDEFVAFCKHAKRKEIIGDIAKRINEELVTAAKKIMGDDMKIPLGASIGAVFVPEDGMDYQELFKLADKALYNVKENGKHGAEIYTSGADKPETDPERCETLKSITKLFEERSIKSGAFRIGPEAFVQVYHYFIRYIKRYSHSAFKVLITLDPSDNGSAEYRFYECVEAFGDTLCKPLRSSDVVVQIHSNQFFLLFPDINQENLDKLTARILDQWNATSFSQFTTVRIETEEIDLEKIS